MPVRTAEPEKLVGLVDQLKSPAYSTGVGLLHWAAALTEDDISASPAVKNRTRRRINESSREPGHCQGLVQAAI